ncbi:DoxX family protein [Paludisphaera soli]|uniref:DoxX family protein n=1 Tax=Paludisphaera soli TaxID=2712865 RepID=UPI0013ED5831|nr:DoxX family protein [Paludisphaera soli]
MDKRKIAYWAATGITAFVFLAGGAADLIRPAEVVKGMAELGYPAYFLLILGVWKVLGGLVVLAPGTPLLKEWAYAGMIFDLTGASASHAAVGDPTAKAVIPLVIAAVVMASWALRPASRRLPGVPFARTATTVEPALEAAR